MKKRLFFIVTSVLICVLSGVFIFMCSLRNNSNESNSQFDDNLLFDISDNNAVKLSTQVVSGNEYILTATVIPADIIVDDVNFEIAWDENVEEITSNYVSMEPVEDDPLSVKLTYIKQFNTTMTVTCTVLSAGNMKTAECKIECYQRYVSSDLYISISDINSNEIDKNINDHHVTFDYSNLKLDDIIFNGADVNVALSGTKSVNTMPNIYLKLSSELRGFFDNAGLTYVNETFDLQNSLNGLSIYESFVSYFVGEEFESKFDEYISSLNETEIWFELYVEITAHDPDSSEFLWQDSNYFYLTGFNVDYYSNINELNFNANVVVF